MLKEMAIKKLFDIGIKNVVYERIIDLSSVMSELNQIKFHSIEDVRSATFYACGMSQETDEAIGLVISEESLPNIYTGLTEAWFQRRPIVVIALCSRVLNKNIDYLNNCTEACFKIQNDLDIEQFFQDVSIVDSPIVMLIEEEYNRNHKVINFDLMPLINQLDSSDQVILSSAIKTDLNLPQIHKVPVEYRYGLFSKYMGYLLGNDSRTILVADYDSVKLDMNIFNNRYICTKFKMILLKVNQEFEVDGWIESNGIKVMYAQSFNENIVKSFLEFNAPSLLVINCY